MNTDNKTLTRHRGILTIISIMPSLTFPDMTFPCSLSDTPALHTVSHRAYTTATATLYWVLDVLKIEKLFLLVQHMYIDCAMRGKSKYHR